MSYKIVPAYATIDQEGDYVDIYKDRRTAELALLEATRYDPHTRLTRVEKGWCVVDKETGVSPSEAKDFHWDEWEAQNEANDLEYRATDEDLDNLRAFARQRGAYIGGDLRQEVIHFLEEQYLGKKVKVISVEGTQDQYATIKGKKGIVETIMPNGDAMTTFQLDAPGLNALPIRIPLRFGKDKYAVVNDDD